MSDEHDDLADRWSQRLEPPGVEATGDSTQSQASPSPPSDSGQSPEIDRTTPVKERPSVLMYLPEDIHTELDVRFDELNAKYKREYGTALEKNRDYYPALIKAGLEGIDVEDVLDI